MAAFAILERPVAALALRELVNEQESQTCCGQLRPSSFVAQTEERGYRPLKDAPVDIELQVGTMAQDDSDFGRNLARSGGSREDAFRISENAAWGFDQEIRERQRNLAQMSSLSSSGGYSGTSVGSGGGYFPFGVIAEFCCLFYGLGGTKIFTGENAGYGLLFGIVLFVVYVFVVGKFTYTTLFVWTLVALRLRDGSNDGTMYLWICIMAVDRLVLDERDNLKHRCEALFVAASAAVALNYFVGDITAKFMNSGPGIIDGYKLAKTPDVVADTKIGFYRYDEKTDSYRFCLNRKCEYVQKGGVIKIKKIIGGSAFACVGSQSAMFDTLSLLRPFNESERAWVVDSDAATFSEDHRNEVCEIKIPKKYLGYITIK